MPRYHLKIKGLDVRRVREEVRIDVKGRKRSEVTVELRAKNEAAATKQVKARLEDRSGLDFGKPVKVKD